MKFKYLYISIVIFVILMSGQALKGQDTFRETESLTYRLYLSQSWDSLICEGRKALRKNIDYFWLHSRMGTAYYKQGKYFPAAQHFRMAQEFDGSDTFSREMLYWSYRSTGRNYEARALTSGMDSVQKNDLGEKEFVLNNLYVELGGAISNGLKKSDPAGLMGSDSIYGEQDNYGNDYFGHFDFTLNLSPRISLVAGYSYLNFAKQKLFQYVLLEDDSLLNRRYVNNTYDYFVLQHEFHLGGIIIPDNATRIMPAIHAINVRYSMANARITHIKDTAFTNYVFSLGIVRDFGRIQLGLSGSWSNLNGKEQTQFTWSGTWYPLGNLDLYSCTSVTEILEKHDDRVVFSETVGGKLVKWLWMEGSFTWGNLVNGNTNQAMVVYNSTDRIRYIAGARLIFPVLKNINISAMYQYFNKEIPVYYYGFSGVGPPSLQTRWEPYQTNNLYLGINFTL